VDDEKMVLMALLLPDIAYLLPDGNFYPVSIIEVSRADAFRSPWDVFIPAKN
jgi:hypothetical protein